MQARFRSCHCWCGTSSYVFKQTWGRGEESLIHAGAFADLFQESSICDRLLTSTCTNKVWVCARGQEITANLFVRHHRVSSSEASLLHIGSFFAFILKTQTPPAVGERLGLLRWGKRSSRLEFVNAGNLYTHRVVQVVDVSRTVVVVICKRLPPREACCSSMV